MTVILETSLASSVVYTAIKSVYHGWSDGNNSREKLDLLLEQSQPKINNSDPSANIANFTTSLWSHNTGNELNTKITDISDITDISTFLLKSVLASVRPVFYWIGALSHRDRKRIILNKYVDNIDKNTKSNKELLHLLPFYFDSPVDFISRHYYDNGKIKDELKKETLQKDFQIYQQHIRLLENNFESRVNNLYLTDRNKDNKKISYSVTMTSSLGNKTIFLDVDKIAFTKNPITYLAGTVSNTTKIKDLNTYLENKKSQGYEIILTGKKADLPGFLNKKLDTTEDGEDNKFQHNNDYSINTKETRYLHYGTENDKKYIKVTSIRHSDPHSDSEIDYMHIEQCSLWERIKLFFRDTTKLDDFLNDKKRISLTGNYDNDIVKHAIERIDGKCKEGRELRIHSSKKYHLDQGSINLDNAIVFSQEENENTDYDKWVYFKAYMKTMGDIFYKTLTKEFVKQEGLWAKFLLLFSIPRILAESLLTTIFMAIMLPGALRKYRDEIYPLEDLTADLNSAEYRVQNENDKSELFVPRAPFKHTNGHSKAKSPGIRIYSGVCKKETTVSDVSSAMSAEHN